jgi:hypothetical protein
MRNLLYIIFSILINFSVIGQIDSQPDSVSFDRILCRFKETKGWNVLAGEINDSVSTSCLYKTKDFSVSISKNPIFFEIDTLVIKNPFYTDDFDDWDDNYINFPISFSVIYEENLISLFDNGKFVCYNINDISRNKRLENELNTKRFKHHWVIGGSLYAQSKSIFFNGLYQWNGAKWVISQIKIPVDKQSILFSDEKFIVYGECSGEFGGTIYFFDRQSKETYFTESTCANTVFKKNGQYQILAQLGHMMGTSEIKVIENPQKLTKAKKGQLKNRKKLGENLGYQDKTNAFTKSLDLFGIQLFSTFQINDRRLFLVHLNEKTFLAEIDGKEIQIVNPLFNNDKYTHNPITKSYGEYTLINMDFYGIAIDREVSVMIIKDDKIILLDWNENHNR